MISGFFGWAMPVALGALGAVITWVILEFVGKPFRAFFDLNRESIEALTLYGNVRARTKELVFRNDDGLAAYSSSPKIETVAVRRLREAEETFRLFGSRFHAFARTERLAVLVLRVSRFEPAAAGRGFIGLSIQSGSTAKPETKTGN